MERNRIIMECEDSKTTGGTMGCEDIDMTDMSTALVYVFMSDPEDRPFVIGDLLKCTHYA